MAKSKKSTLGLVFFPAFDWMISPGHPERQERLLYTRDQLEEEGLFDCEEIREYRPRLAEINDLQRAHVGVPAISRVITPAHLTSAGGCLVAADAVMKGEVQRAFALVRPPGHHAMRVVHGIRGFCTVNIEAIMVEYLRSKYGIRKIAVVDTDVHHGDGSQDVFYHDPNTLYISFHQDGRTLYPGTGFPQEAGSPAAWGTNINLPLLPGTGDEGLHRLYDGLISHILEDFEPELNYDYDASLYARGESLQLRVTNLPSGVAVTWRSDDETVAKVSQTGEVTAIGGGKTTVTATVGDKSVQIIIRCNFGDAEITGAHLERTDVTVRVGEKFDLYLYDSEGEHISDITYTVGNPDVCKVQDGIVTVTGSGTTTITVTFNGQEFTCIVRVH